MGTGDGAWTVGELIRECRNSLGLSMEAVAAGGGPSKAVLSKWERDPWGGGVEFVERLDRHYDQRGALSATAAAVRLMCLLPPEQQWRAHPPESRFWAWFRSPSPSRAEVSWGPWRLDVSVPGSRNGLVIEAPFGIPEPPLTVEFERPGWFAIGNGRFPRWVGAPVRDGYHLLLPGTTPDPLLNLLGRSLQKMTPDTIRRDLRLSNATLAALRQHSMVRARDLPPEPVGTAGPMYRTVADGELARTARGAHGLSLNAAVEFANRMGDPARDRLSLHKLRRLEDLASAEDFRAVSRLDRMYGLDGRLVAGPVVDAAPNELSVAFPAHWIGPVWVQLTRIEGSSGSRLADLTWGIFRKQLELREDRVLVETRRTYESAGPLTVRADGWRIVAGVGRQPEAADINEGWRAQDQDVVRRTATILRQLRSALRNAGTPENAHP